MISFLNNLISGLSPDKGLARVEGNGGALQQDTANLFTQGLKRGLGVDLPATPANDPAASIFDVQAVVDNVAGFIEQRIEQARGDGASQDELNDLISQAREGVERGFGLARGDIENLGLLNPELSENIDAAEEGINGRIDQLEDNLSTPDDGVISNLSGSFISETNSFQRSRASFQFELTTQEGDRVRISAREFIQSQERSSAIQTEDGAASTIDTRFSYASSFSIKVKGDLNEDERAAIDNLLGQVANISDSFFAGGVAEAFNQALGLDFNGEQIARFSLDLEASTVSVVERTEFTTVPRPAARIPDEYRPPELPAGLQTVLTNYAEQVKDFVESSRELAEKLNARDPGDSLAKTLQREFDQSVGRGLGQREFFDALLEQLS